MRISDWSSDVCSSDLIGVIYTRRFIPRDEHRRADIEGREPSGGIPFLKWFTVFSVEQCDGLPAHICEPPPPIPEGLILPQAEALIAATGADFRIGGPSAFYSPTRDYVQVPRPDRSEEHTSELQSLMRISYAVLCLKKKNRKTKNINALST